MSTNNIHFKVTGWGDSADRNLGLFTLVADSWDDFGFKTTYKLYYTSQNGKVTELGYVKVASRGMADDSPHTKLPNEFSQLPSQFFSLGQDREYYEKFMQLSEGMGIKALRALRDVAIDQDIYELVQNEEVFTTSFLRSMPANTVTTQFRRIIAGKAVLTPYRFSYIRPSDDISTPSLHLDFDVSPGAMPSTNVHVLIGANGVGKSMLLRDFVSAARGLSDARGAFKYGNASWLPEAASESFVNGVHVAYSAFDARYVVPASLMKGLKFHTVGLATNSSLEEQFMQSFQGCTKGPRRERWISAVRKLESADPLLADMALGRFLESPAFDIDAELGQRFSSMSSGHKIVILTITRLVELVEEQSLVLLDEPETHLHPPLLSALIRAISDLMIDRNGVAIIATHSPVILQEVPRSCVWRLQRSGTSLRAFRLDAESFGESVSKLTSAVFHLDVRRTGYHEVLRHLVSQGGTADAVLETIDNQLGDEGRFVLSSLAYPRDEGHV